MLHVFFFCSALILSVLGDRYTIEPTYITDGGLTEVYNLTDEDALGSLEDDIICGTKNCHIICNELKSLSSVGSGPCDHKDIFASSADNLIMECISRGACYSTNVITAPKLSATIMCGGDIAWKSEQCSYNEFNFSTTEIVNISCPRSESCSNMKLEVQSSKSVSLNCSNGRSCDGAYIYGQEVTNGISITCRGIWSCQGIHIECPYSYNGLYKDDPINNNAFCFIDCDNPPYLNYDDNWYNSACEDMEVEIYDDTYEYLTLYCHQDEYFYGVDASKTSCYNTKLDCRGLGAVYPEGSYSPGGYNIMGYELYAEIGNQDIYKWICQDRIGGYENQCCPPYADNWVEPVLPTTTSNESISLTSSVSPTETSPTNTQSEETSSTETGIASKSAVGNVNIFVAICISIVLIVSVN